MNNRKTSMTPFMSAQPEFERNNSNYLEYTIKSELTNSDILFYQFKTHHKERNNLFAVPDGCLDILFCCDEKAPASNLYGSVFEYKKVDVKPDTEYFGIRFLPKDMVKGNKYILKEIMNHIIPLEDIISLEPRLIEKVAVEKTLWNG